MAGDSRRNLPLLSSEPGSICIKRLMLVLAAAYVSVTAVPAMRPAIHGLTAAVVGILLATTYRLGKANIPDRITLGIALASIVAGAVLGISAAVIVVAAGLLGIGLYAPRSVSRQRRETHHDA